MKLTIDSPSNGFSINRRKFLRDVADSVTGWDSVAADGLCAGRRTTAAQRGARRAVVKATAAAAPPQGISRVAFVKTDDREAGMRQAIAISDRLAWRARRSSSNRTSTAPTPLPARRTLDMLRTLVEQLRGDGCRRASRSATAAAWATRAVMEAAGRVRPGHRRWIWRRSSSTSSDADGWVPIASARQPLAARLRAARPLPAAEAVVQTCNLKTHRFGGHFTLSLKNSVGLAAKRVPGEGYNYMTELHSSRHQRRMIAEINAAYAPALIVLDGVEAFIDRRAGHRQQGGG